MFSAYTLPPSFGRSLRLLLLLLAGLPTLLVSAAGTLEFETPLIEVPASLTFTLATPGVSSQTQTLTIRNTGTSVLAIERISSFSRDFQVEVPEGLNEIAPNASADIQVTFRPTRAFSVLSATLLINSNAGGSFGNTLVNLRGNNPLRQTNEINDDDGDADNPAPAPRLVIASNRLNFLLDIPGVTTQSKTITLRNEGTATFRLSEVNSSSPNFLVADPTPTEIPAGDSLTVTITYQPQTALSFHSGSLSIGSGNFVAASITLFGNNPLRQTNTEAPVVEEPVEEEPVVELLPQIEVPAMVSFALTSPETTTQTQTVTVRNTGNGLLTFDTIRVFPEDFSVAIPAGLSELAAGESVDLNVTYQPRLPLAQHSGNLTIRSNSGGTLTSSVVSLAGSNPLGLFNQELEEEEEEEEPVVETPLLEVPAQLTFNLNTPGVTTQTQTLTLRNTGRAPLSVEVLNLRSEDFSVEVPEGLTVIAAGASADIQVTFSPVRTFSILSTNLTIRSNSGGNVGNTFITLLGNNPLRQSNQAAEDPADTAPAPRLVIEATRLNFLLDSPDETTQTKFVTLRNTGGGTLEIASIRVFPADFVLDLPTEPIQLAAGASTDVQITYRPRRPFSRHFGSLTITSNSGNAVATARITLRGANPLRLSNPTTSGLAVPSDSGSSLTAATTITATVYPNPVGNTANLRIDAPQDVRAVTVTVTDLNGRTLRRAQVATYGNTTSRVDVADLKAGLYLLRVSDEAGKVNYTTRLVKR